VPVSIRARAAVVFAVLRPVAPASPERDPCIASVLPDCVRLEAFELGPDAVPAKLAQDSGADAGAGAEADAEEQLGRAPAIFGRDFDAGALAGEAKDGVTRVFPCVLLDFFNAAGPSARVAGGAFLKPRVGLWHCVALWFLAPWVRQVFTPGSARDLRKAPLTKQLLLSCRKHNGWILGNNSYRLRRPGCGKPADAEHAPTRCAPMTLRSPAPGQAHPAKGRVVMTMLRVG
jgi:hypothetical protein